MEEELEEPSLDELEFDGKDIDMDSEGDLIWLK
jgi:hypothetical protein